jgi:hypothetical protein
VLSLEKEEAPGDVFLIFAPTYNHLEQIYDHLHEAWKQWQETNNPRDQKQLSISVLHRSIDIEDCLRSMQAVAPAFVTSPNRIPRRIILASAIADSSITIPRVSCVIDTCRSLQVKWDPAREVHSSRTIWASQSICDQRKGRTGRTNPGQVYRLVPKHFYVNKLEAHETPQLTLSDCRNELLQLLTSTVVSTKSGNPIDLLAKTLDPPPTAVVDDAVDYLVELGACSQKQRRNNDNVLVPTKYGHLLAELPFTAQDSVCILMAGQYGLLHEMLLLKSIDATRPYPIVHHFADEQKSKAALHQFHPQLADDEVNPLEISPSMAAHMSAYMFWDAEWNRGRRWTAMQSFLQQTTSEARSARGELADKGVWKWSTEVEEAHLAWCKKHEINPTSVRAVTETMDVAMEILFKAAFEPKWLYCTDTEPLWRSFASSDSHNQQTGGRYRMFGILYGSTGDELLQKLKRIVLREPPIGQSQRSTQEFSSPSRRVLCTHFLRGHCRYGDQCRNSHSTADPNSHLPVCHFYLAGRCNRGNACAFAHSMTPLTATSSRNVQAAKNHLEPLVPLSPSTSALLSTGPENLFKEHTGSAMLFGEGDFSFSKALYYIGAPPRLATIQGPVTATQRVSLTGIVPILGECDITRVHESPIFMPIMSSHFSMGLMRLCAWNFPYANKDDEHDQVHEELIQGAFMSLAHLFTALQDQHGSSFFGNGRPSIPDPLFALTLQGDQFSRWSVHRSARRAGWKLSSWCPFDPSTFPGYTPKQASGDAFPCRNPRLYLFSLQNRHCSIPKEEECAICLMEMDDETAVLLRTCRHVFCRTCLDRVLTLASTDDSHFQHSSISAACPLCRTPFHHRHMERRS